MNLLSHLSLTIAALTLPMLPAHSMDRGRDGSLSTLPTAQQSDGPGIGCAATHAASIPIPFDRVDLGQAVARQRDDGVLLGPRMLVVVTDSTHWPAAWNAAVATLVVPSEWKGDSLVPVPRVAFGNDVIVLVGTRTYGMGSTYLRVTSIRECRRSGVVVVTTTQTGPGSNGVGTAMRSRGLDVVRARGRRLATSDVVFEHRYQSER